MLILILVAALGGQPTSESQKLEFIRLSYKANKEAFAYGSFPFRYTRGSSKNLSDAQAGVFSRSVHAEGFYAFDGTNARFELIPNPEELAAATTRVGERGRSSYVSTFRMLTDGKVTLLDTLGPDQSRTALTHRAAIFPEAGIFYRRLDFPLYVGDKTLRGDDLFGDLTGLQQGLASLLELDLDSRLGDRKVCKLSLSYKDGTLTYWIDLDRGSVPLQIFNVANGGNTRITVTYDNLQFVANRGWLPFRRVHVIDDGKVVDWIEIDQVDCKTKPGASVFQLEFPEPVGLVDQARKLAYSRRKTWSLLDLPGPHSRGTKPAIPVSFPPPPEMQGEDDSPSRWKIGLVLISAILLVSLVWLSVRIVIRKSGLVGDTK